MSGFLLRRFAASLLLLLFVLSATFFLLHAAPGDPINLYESPRMTDVQREHLRRLYGLDRPLPEQYLRFLGAALRGDWGSSLVQHRPAMTVVREAVPATVALAFAALLVRYGAGCLLGVAAASRRDRPADHAIRIASLVLFSVPTFWLGLMAILVFSYLWPVLPASHMHSIGADELGPAAQLYDLLRHLVLPALVLGLPTAGATARFVRNGLLEVMGQDYVRAARAKGLSERRVLWVHGLRNALLPVVETLALALPALLSGALVTEVVFAWPGLGRLTFDAILTRDYPVVLAATALAGALVVFGSLAADLLHGAVDPRLRDFRDA